jgi:hypothetical protein
VVVSFFNTFALDALYRRLRDTLRGRARKDRLPIPYATLAAEMRSTGFRIQKKIAVRWGLSPHWYVVAA